MTALIPDELLEMIAVVGSRDEIAALIYEKVEGLADIVPLECTRRPDPDHFACIVPALRPLTSIQVAFQAPLECGLSRV